MKLQDWNYSIRCMESRSVFCDFGQKRQLGSIFRHFGMIIEVEHTKEAADSYTDLLVMFGVDRLVEEVVAVEAVEAAVEVEAAHVREAARQLRSALGKAEKAV